MTHANTVHLIGNDGTDDPPAVTVQHDGRRQRDGRAIRLCLHDTACATQDAVRERAVELLNTVAPSE